MVPFPRLTNVYGTHSELLSATAQEEVEKTLTETQVLIKDVVNLTHVLKSAKYHFKNKILT